MKQQLSFFPSPNKNHGGELSKGKRKIKRPVVTRSPMHLVLKSNESALLKNEKTIRQILQKFSDRFFVRIYAVSVNSNHIHLCLRAKTREGFHHFERAVAGTIALALSSSKLGRACLRSFWKDTIYSRLVNWGQDFKNILLYIYKNELEARGLVRYSPRNQKKNQKKNRQKRGIFKEESPSSPFSDEARV